MRKVLVTGSRGFIGRHTVEYLKTHTDWELVDDYTTGITDVIHLASISEVAPSLADPISTVSKNVAVTHQLLEWARTQKLHTLIQVSSGEVYGATPIPASEETPFNPPNPYAASKVAQEALCLAYRQSFGVPTVIVTTQNVFGQHQQPHKFIPTIVHRLKQSLPITVFVDAKGNPGVRRYIHADALAESFRQVILAPQHERYHAAGEEDISHVEMVERIAEIMGVEPTIDTVTDTTAQRGKEGTYWLDSTRLRSTGWCEPESFDASLKRTVEALWH